MVPPKRKNKHGGPHLIRGNPNRTKRLSKRTFLPFELEYQSFPAFELEMNIGSSWISSLLGFGLDLTPLGSQTFRLRLELHYWLSWVLACQLHIMRYLMGLLILHNHMSLFFIIIPI